MTVPSNINVDEKLKFDQNNKKLVMSNGAVAHFNENTSSSSSSSFTSTTSTSTSTADKKNETNSNYKKVIKKADKKKF